MSKQIVLTGITTTGTPHIGNYLGAIKPAIAASQQPDVQSYYFLADYHALIKCHDPERISASTRAIAATWIALGLDTERATFYRQSDIPEIAELTWILTCHTAKGLMNRAHAYKASVDQNRESGQEDLDDGINMGLFSYPILMAADILMFKANRVPVGKDQAQHIEMARDIASRFNHQFAPLLTLPEAQIDSDTQLIPGLDGRKMSKSYDNTLPLFAEPDELYRLIKLIKTDSKAPGEPKQTEHNTLFQLFSFFGSETETKAYREAFANGIAWGDAKKQLFECIDAYLAKPRERYKDLLHNLDTVENILQAGAAKARAQSHPLMQDIRAAVGIRPLTSQAVKVTPTHSKKEKSADELAKLEAGRQRAILLQLQPQLEAIAAADDPKAMALSLLKTKQLEIDTLKKKAKQKAENELAVLQNALSEYLN